MIYNKLSGYLDPKVMKSYIISYFYDFDLKQHTPLDATVITNIASPQRPKLLKHSYQTSKLDAGLKQDQDTNKMIVCFIQS